MPKMKLTKSSIDRVARPGLTTGDALYWDTESRGFGLRVTPTGLAKFISQGRVRGTNREVRTTIGTYGAWTVDDARRRAEEIRHQLEDGKDPREQWRQSEAEQVTLRQVADLYQAREGKMRDSTKAEMDRHVDKVFAAWRAKPIAAITEQDVRRRHKEMCESGLDGRPAPGQAQISLVTLRTLVNFANRRFKRADGSLLIPHNPVHSMRDDWRQFEPRTRHVELDKVGEVWNRLADLRSVARDTNALSGVDLVQFLMLTGARKGEGGSLRWEQVHLDNDPAQCWWHLPNPKNGNPVWLPLSSQAVALLRARPRFKLPNGDDNPFVFPSSAKCGHITDARAPLERLRDIHGIASDGSGVVSAHDLRRTFVTVGFSSCGIDLFKLELLTNHVPQGVTARHYLQTSRLQYLHPEAQAIGDWIEQQAAIAASKNVVPMRRAEAA
jgi:integrase